MKPQRVGSLAHFSPEGWLKIQEDLDALFWTLGGRIDQSNLSDDAGVQKVDEKKPKRFASVAAVSAATSRYKVQDGKYAVLDSILACNTTGSTVALRVYIVPNGVASAAASNAVLYDVPVPPKTTMSLLDADIVLNQGDRIADKASRLGVTMTYSGEEKS